MAEAAAEPTLTTTNPSAQEASHILSELECLEILCKQEIMILVAGVITWMQEYNSHLAKISTPNYVSAFFQALTAPTQKISNITFYNSWIKNLKQISTMSIKAFAEFVDNLYEQLNTNSKNANNDPNRINIAHKLLPSLKALHEYVKGIIRAKVIPTNANNGDGDGHDYDNNNPKSIASQLIFALAALANSTSNHELTHLVYDPSIRTQQSELLIPGCPQGSFTKECFVYILSALNFYIVVENMDISGSRATCVFDARFNAAANSFANAAVDNLYNEEAVKKFTTSTATKVVVVGNRSFFHFTQPHDVSGDAPELT